MDPPSVLCLAGINPDPWQHDLLCDKSAEVLLNTSRQAGKSTVSAGVALRQALIEPNSLVLLLSPSLRQSSEIFRKVMDLFGALGRPVPVRAESALRLELTNGSRVVSLPGDEATVRGFSGVRLLVIDEASRVDDSLFFAVRPMLSVSRGRLIALSTPAGRRGWWYEQWVSSYLWKRIKVVVDQCPRVGRDFLENERQVLGPRWFAQEYYCEFLELLGAAFSGALIDALPDPALEVRPFPEAIPC
jgi:hypothetical protein